MKKSPPKSNVFPLRSHPKPALERIRAVVARGAVQMSMALNDLMVSRQVQMSEIWRCLEEGELVGGLARTGGKYQSAELVLAVAGRDVHIRVIIFKDPDGQDALEITAVSANEEEE